MTEYKCVKCKAPVAHKGQMCDQCLGAYFGAVGELYAAHNVEIQDVEFKLAHGVLMTREEWSKSLKLNDSSVVDSDEGYEEYASKI